jgi:hypothetical protein
LVQHPPELHDPAARRPQGRQCGAQHRQVRQHIRLEGRAGLGVADLLHRAEQPVAGVVDQHVQTAGRLDRGAQRGLRVRRGDVQDERRDPGPGGPLGGEPAEQLGSAAHRDDVRAAVEGPVGDETPEPGRGAGDQPSFRHGLTPSLSMSLHQPTRHARPEP